MIRVLAIDPGTRNTGVALVDERGVSCAARIRFSEPLGTDNAAIIARSGELAERLQPILDAWRHDVVVLEGYTPWSYGDGNAAATTQLLILVGWLSCHLKAENLHIQYSDDVLAPSREHSIFWHLGINPRATKGMDKVARLRLLEGYLPGGEKCKGDKDMIAAAAHGLWYVREHERLF